MNKKYINSLNELMEKFDFELLLKTIHDNKLTCEDIQEIYGIEKRFMSKLNKEMNLGIKKSWKQQKDRYLSLGIYKDDLYDLYIIQEKSLNAISREYNVSGRLIYNALLFFNICEKDDIRPSNYNAYYNTRRTKNKYDNESREYQTIMKNHIGRELTSTEVVHHIDCNRSNNDISNLYLFDTERIHAFYHGYIKSHDYIHPQDFIDNIYSKYLDTFLNKDWLHEQYIILDKSINEISLLCEVSRGSIKYTLTDLNLIDSKPMRINQYY